jgi:ATP synthase protein I
MKYQREFLIFSMLPSLIIGVVGTIFASVVLGSEGFTAGIFALFFVFIFLMVHFLVLIVAPRISPIRTMALAMGSFFIKVIVVILCLFTLNPIAMNKRAFGIIAIATMTAWLSGEIWAYSTAWTKKNRG